MYHVNAKHQAKCAIVVLNWNGWQDTIACLESLSQLTYENYSVIVVDNASTDESPMKLTEWGEKHNSLVFDGDYEQNCIHHITFDLEHRHWVYLQSNTNNGYASGNNLGIQLAVRSQCEYIWLLNNDTVVDAAALNKLVSCIQQDSTIGLCGSLLRFFDNQHTVQAAGGVNFNFLKAQGEQLGQGMRVDDEALISIASKSPTYISGASVLLPREFVDDVGLMEESYFLYFEELDWAERAKPKWKTATALDSIVFHKEGASIGTASLKTRSHLSQYYLNKNLIRFYCLRKKHLIPFALLKVVKEIFHCLRKGELGLSKVTLQALVDALLMKAGKTYENEQ